MTTSKGIWFMLTLVCLVGCSVGRPVLPHGSRTPTPEDLNSELAAGNRIHVQAIGGESYSGELLKIGDNAISINIDPNHRHAVIVHIAYDEIESIEVISDSPSKTVGVLAILCMAVVVMAWFLIKKIISSAGMN